MGGINEKTLNSPVPDIASIHPSQPVQVSNLRLHENKGEVHIHDDINKRKVAVEVAQFYQAWRRFKTSMLNRERMMLVGKDGLTAALFIADLESDPPDVIISIIDVASHSNLSKIENFIAGK